MGQRRQRLFPVHPSPTNDGDPVTTLDLPFQPEITLPPILPALPALPPMYTYNYNHNHNYRAPDLSSISRGEVDIPSESFKLSPTMQQLQGGDAQVFDAIIDECRNYAEGRKELVRGAFKKRQREAGVPLSTIDKSKLRSRREAKVTRVKEREFEAALKDVIRWFITQRNANQ